MVVLSGRAAINSVLESELGRDQRTVYLGETIRKAGSSGASYGLYDRFGPKQIIETPVSENGIVGVALGLGLSGYRPIVEIYTADFLLTVANEVLSDIPKWRHQHRRRGGLPITIRTWMGSTLGRGPEHSQCMEAYLHHAPGLTVIAPSTPRDLAGLLRAAIRSDEPCVVLEHRVVYDLEEEVPDDPDFVLPIGKGEIIRSGMDLTIVAWGSMRREAMAAADTLSEQGISAEVIDPRTIKPMDHDLIKDSVLRTGALLIAEESPITGNVGAEIVARLVQAAWTYVPVARVSMEDVIHPYSSRMEAEILPRAADIVAASTKLVGARAAQRP